MKNFFTNLFGSGLVEFDEDTEQGQTPQSYTEVSNRTLWVLIGVIVLMIICEFL